MDLCDRYEISIVKCAYDRQTRSWSLVTKIAKSDKRKCCSYPLKKPAQFYTLDIKNNDPDFINKMFPE